MNDLEKNLDYYIPDPHCELEYNKDYELLISVMLSAQCTDKKVNEVAKNLYKYDLQRLASLDIKDLEKIIRPLGSYHKKSEYIKNICNILLKEYNGHVPKTRKELEKLPGIGRKCASVILAQLYSIPTIAVDTHVDRVSKRLGIAKKNDSLIQVENKIKRLFSKEKYNKINHQLLLFGRYYCTAKNPKCLNCKMNCQNKKENN